MKMNNELIAKAKEAKTAEELMALAKESGEEITEESAKAYFDLLNPKTGELSDEELDNVAGGGCYSDGGRLKTTSGYKCKHYADGQSTYGIKGTCCRCKYWDHKGGNGYEVMGSPLKCLNPNNAKKA